MCVVCSYMHCLWSLSRVAAAPNLNCGRGPDDKFRTVGVGYTSRWLLDNNADLLHSCTEGRRLF